MYYGDLSKRHNQKKKLLTIFYCMDSLTKSLDEVYGHEPNIKKHHIQGQFTLDH